MLKLVKNIYGEISKVTQTVTQTRRAVLLSVFAVAVLVGFGLPYFGFGNGTTAAAESTIISATVDNQTSGTVPAVIYTYKQMSLHDVYPYYIAASFMVAGGLSLYALSYIPSRAERRSRYASRFDSWARTTY